MRVVVEAGGEAADGFAGALAEGVVAVAAFGDGGGYHTAEALVGGVGVVLPTRVGGVAGGIGGDGAGPGAGLAEQALAVQVVVVDGLCAAFVVVGAVAYAVVVVEQIGAGGGAAEPVERVVVKALVVVGIQRIGDGFQVAGRVVLVTEVLQAGWRGCCAQGLCAEPVVLVVLACQVQAVAIT